MHGVPVVKSTLCHVRDGPSLACSWISPKADLCPHWEQDPSIICVFLYIETWGTVLMSVIQVVGQPGKMPLWLLLPSPPYMRNLGQFLIAYTFTNLVALYLQHNTCRIMAGVSRPSNFFLVAFGLP